MGLPETALRVPAQTSHGGRPEPGSLGALPPPHFDGERHRRERQTGGVRWHDEARFIKTWLENPRGTGAISPSSRALSRAIAREVDPALPGPVIELGPGTGPVTDALIRRGIAPERLILVEYEAAFCRLLARRYPACRIIQGDAYSLDRTLRPFLQMPAAAIVSGLPLLNRPEYQRLALLADAFALMCPGAPFVQFTYGMISPVPRHGPAEVTFKAHGSAPVWMNMPPARVWTYRALPGCMVGDNEPDLIDRLKLGSERLGEEWREHRDRLRAEWLARSADAKAEWRARTQRMKTGLARHQARIKATREGRAGTGWDKRLR